MELELGLALPAVNPIIKGFDLNCCAFESKEALGCSNNCTPSASCSGSKLGCKRGFDVAFHQDVPKPMVTRTLPLLLWNDKPNDEDDRKTPLKSSCAINQSDGEGNGIVGWPPIKSWRKKLQNHQQQNQIGPRRDENNRDTSGNDGIQNSTYVKVKMEGEAIGRKVDLSLHSSYQTLKATLIDMFGKCQINMNNGPRDGKANYTLAYQDKEGDWLLVGDVPWQSFIQSVQRLKIQRNVN